MSVPDATQSLGKLSSQDRNNTHIPKELQHVYRAGMQALQPGQLPPREWTQTKGLPNKLQQQSQADTMLIECVNGQLATLEIQSDGWVSMGHICTVKILPN